MVTPRDSVVDATEYIAPLEGRGNYIRLDFNENTAATKTLNQYPEYGRALKSISDSFKLDPDCILLTNGSSEALFLISFAFIEPGKDAALTSSPTFSLIPHYLRICGSKLIEVNVTEELEFDVKGIESELSNIVKIVILASPENPTGAILNQQVLRKWLQKFPDTLFVIDAAYAEYSSENPDVSLVQEFDNILLLRTFSKAMGMAGSRLGLIFGSGNLISAIAKVKAPYNVNSAALEAAILALKNRDAIEDQIQKSIELREQITRELDNQGYAIHSGQSNFFLMSLGADASNFVKYCRNRGILLRDRSHIPGLAGKIRVSIGTEIEMRKFIELTKLFQQNSALIFDLDDTLVDASTSYPEIVKKVVTCLNGIPPTSQQYWRLKASGGFNDDWLTSREFLARQNISVSLDQVEKIGKALYLESAKSLEKLFISKDTLSRLRKRYRLFVFTGRPRDEYEPIWGEVLNPEFEQVYCTDDFENLNPKPAPDMLDYIKDKHNIQNAWYIGNSVDDIVAAKSANMGVISVATTLTIEFLSTTDSDRIIQSVEQLPGVFSL